MDKIKARDIAKQNIEAMSGEYCNMADSLICQKILNSDFYKSADTVFCFIKKDKEIDLLKVIEKALAKGKTVCVPKCTQNGNMRAYKIDCKDDLEVGKFGILEPKGYCNEVAKEHIDLALIPALACDKFGGRVGYGKGYYDNFLKDVNCTKMVVCREKMLSEKLEQTPDDITADIVVTEEEVIEVFC